MTGVLAGEYDLSNTDDLEQRLAVVFDQPGNVVQVDLADVEFIDCQALAVLLSACAEAERRGATVCLRRPSPVIRRMLEISGVGRMVDVAIRAD